MSTSRFRKEVRHAALVSCQPLERRMLLSLSPAGSEFRANTTVAGAQTNSAIVADGDGDFVVVWQSDQESPGGIGIYAGAFFGF